MTNCILFAALLTFLTCAACKAVPRDTSEMLKLSTNISTVGPVHIRKEVKSSSFSIEIERCYNGHKYQHRIYYDDYIHNSVISLRSSMLWILHVNCSSIACYGRRMVDNIPSTFVPSNATFESIDPLANATGILGSDKIQVGGTAFVIPRLTFGLALDLQTTELDNLHSGLLGLGLNNVGTNSKPFIRSIIDQGIIGAKVFSIWLEPKYRNNGFITYGAIDVRCELLNDNRPFYGSSYVFSVGLWRIFAASPAVDSPLFKKSMMAAIKDIAWQMNE